MVPVWDVSSLSQEDLAFIKSQCIAEMLDGSGRWMNVDNRTDGSIPMTPVDVQQVLWQRDAEAGREEMPSDTDLSEIFMEEIKIQSNAILKKITLNPSVYWGYTYATKTADKDDKPLFEGDLGD